ncbi:hypothetical protein DL95DRAFT_77857 [Leptodontidium sp. 2 PMI_412]|nr:hypothetical protein DL95DRAFT_77857 [Leptodontidium sp. 2 PMI_412]
MFVRTKYPLISHYPGTYSTEYVNPSFSSSPPLPSPLQSLISSSPLSLKYLLYRKYLLYTDGTSKPKSASQSVSQSINQLASLLPLLPTPNFIPTTLPERGEERRGEDESRYERAGPYLSVVRGKETDTLDSTLEHRPAPLPYLQDRTDSLVACETSNSITHRSCARAYCM